MRNKYIVNLSQLKLSDLELLGGKNASLVSQIYDEKNPNIKRSISNIIKLAKKTKKSWDMWIRTIKLAWLCTVFSRRRNWNYFGNTRIYVKKKKQYIK